MAASVGEIQVDGVYVHILNWHIPLINVKNDNLTAPTASVFVNGYITCS